MFEWGRSARGKVRWSIRQGRPLSGGRGDRWLGTDSYGATPQVVDRGGEWGVLALTTGDSDAGQRTIGLSLLSGEDGHVLWRRTLVEENASPPHNRFIHPTVLLADGDVALVALRRSGAVSVAELRLPAVDVRTGRPLWNRRGFLPRILVSGSVVASEWPGSTSAKFDETRASTVTILDAATGRERWSLHRRMASARLAAAGGLLLVRELNTGAPAEPLILDLAKGSGVGRLPAHTLNCAADRSSPDGTSPFRRSTGTARRS